MDRDLFNEIYAPSDLVKSHVVYVLASPYASPSSCLKLSPLAFRLSLNASRLSYFPKTCFSFFFARCLQYLCYISILITTGFLSEFGMELQSSYYCFALFSLPLCSLLFALCSALLLTVQATKHGDNFVVSCRAAESAKLCVGGGQAQARHARRWKQIEL